MHPEARCRLRCTHVHIALLQLRELALHAAQRVAQRLALAAQRRHLPRQRVAALALRGQLQLQAGGAVGRDLVALLCCSRLGLKLRVRVAQLVQRSLCIGAVAGVVCSAACGEEWGERAGSRAARGCARYT